MRIVFIATGLLVGYGLGYWIGAYLACEVLKVGGNQCGFIGVFYTGPVGMLIGGIIAYFSTSPRDKRDD